MTVSEIKEMLDGHDYDFLRTNEHLKDKSYLQGYHKEKPPKRHWTAFFIPR